jgi:predicted small lipoprotein YifL
MSKKTLSIILLVVAFSGCGKKGPLVLEPENSPPAAENFQVRQVGGQVELSWKFPAQLAEKKGPLEMGLISKVYVYHSLLKPEETPLAEAFIKRADLLAKLKAGEIKGLGQNSPSCRLTFKNRDLQGKTHGFTLLYFYGRKKSAAAPPQALKTLIAPPAVQDLKAARQGKIVDLNWSKPVFQDRERQAMAISGYRIYRRIAGANGEPDFRPINPEAVVNEFFHDLDTGTDGDYEYQVSSCLGDRVESAPSNTVRVQVQDTFPPDVPGNLVLFTAKDQVFLTWEAVPDNDLAFYRVYRKASEKDDLKLLADAVTDNFYRDKLVAHGKLYIYAISAVDKKNNESELSAPVQQVFE